MVRTSRGIVQDRNRRSQEDWERGRGAKRKGNPNYKPVERTYTIGGKRVTKKVYILREGSKII
jgi:hypothetical protein